MRKHLLAEVIVTSVGHPASWRTIGFIVLASFVLNVVYSLAVPPWMGPDEPRHVEYALILADKGRLITWADVTPAIERRIVASMDRYGFWRYGAVSATVYKPGTAPTSFDQIWAQGLTHELHQPPLYYVALAPLVYATRGLDVALQVHVLRLLSAVLGALTVLIIWLTAREAFPDRPLLANLSACFVAFLPMHAFMAGIVNNDIMAEVCGALLLYVAVRMLRRGLSWGLLAAAVAVIVLGLLAKRSTVASVPVLLAAIYLALRRQTGRAPSWPALGLTGAALAGLALLLTPLADFLEKIAPRLPSAAQSMLYVYVLFWLRPSQMHAFTVSPADFAGAEAFDYYRRWLKMLFETFWARFGWVNIRLDWHLYYLLGFLTIVAVAGCCLVIWQAMRATAPAERSQQDVIILLAAGVFFALIVVLVKMVRGWDSVPRATEQARSLFPMLGAIAILFVGGLLRLVPASRHAWLGYGLAGGLIALNLVSLVYYILPFYKG